MLLRNAFNDLSSLDELHQLVNDYQSQRPEQSESDADEYEAEESEPGEEEAPAPTVVVLPILQPPPPQPVYIPTPRPAEEVQQVSFTSRFGQELAIIGALVLLRYMID